ncbi:mechanosensitive ion channel family protein [Mangrovibacterium lignilyticum]|uniref:mechanosensitive ion channel family protein n=1 Tax=Mangrovibacterium lignilyticum TaxID=2668052 RepID=UPI001EE5FCAD|nr:mechanosensitive ion channel family protein [Mangrovibacterium lignilyticum]
MKQFQNWIFSIFSEMGTPQQSATILSVSIAVLLLLVVAILAQLLTRTILLSLIHRFVQKTKTEWDDFLIKRKFFSALAHIPSALIVYAAHDFSDIEIVTDILSIISEVYFVIIFAMSFLRASNAANDIYQTTPYAATRSIKGYIQLLQIVIIFLAVIFGISILINESPLGIFAGLGAMAAVLLLIFKDSILGFVASIQLSANKMLKPGDWIEMRSHNADGTVIDITLNTVKVQNWDKTITTIPTYALVSESFNNWAGMEESGGRRIKRSINLDMKSVRFCDAAMLERLSHFYLLKDYIKTKQEDIQAFNKKLKIEEGDTYNGRRQTNLGIFRHYMEAYLKQNPNIHQDMTFLVRHLQPTELGLPIEIYVFSKDQIWANYEGIQADIFDHVLAILPEFGLQVFQNPSGHDVNELGKNLAFIQHK